MRVCQGLAGGKYGELKCNGYRISAREDGKVLETCGGDNVTI